MKNLLIFSLLLCSITAKSQVDSAHKKQLVFQYVEQMPEPQYDIYAFLSRNIVYPLAAQKSGVQSVVYIKFIVQANGEIDGVAVQRVVKYQYDQLSKSDIQIQVAKLGDGIEEEALRVVKLFAPWKPGKQNGKTVDVFYTLPITFKLR